MEKVNLGVIGTGARAGLVRTMITDEKKRGDIVALCDVNPDHLSRFEKMVETGLGHGTSNYSDYHDLLDDEKVDAVLISTPDFLHHEMAIEAFNAGKHVFLEKPVGINLEQMIEIVRAAQNADTILEIGYVLRYAPFFVGMKQLIDSGEIGTPLFAQALEEYYGAFHFYRGWWKSREHVGGIMIQKICHDMDLHYWFFGKPRKVVAFESLMDFKPGGWDSDALNCDDCQNPCPYYTKAEGSRTGTNECVYNAPHDISDNTQILVQFESGLNLSMGMNFFNARGQSDRHWKVVGSKAELSGRLSTGMVRIDPRHDTNMQNTRYLKFTSGTGGHGGGDALQILEFLDGILEGHEAKAGIESAYWSSILIMGAQKSADEGEIVEIADLTRKYPFPG
ncbi:hypothetical protein GF325_16915 [Candidatus Bathyarchaeota archaeon]|nr:hypothetical protein [Candidatus Bathyarchaeota archaeon]